ncbi:DUF2334 domain-containing protein [Candidatus Pacearchaeota archaeon]|nr:DUF2334 domain-containing protein [Candidatus Pacearchaeota archaeon]
MNKKKKLKKYLFAGIIIVALLFSVFLFYNSQSSSLITNAPITEQKLATIVAGKTIDYSPSGSICSIKENNKGEIILRLDDVAPWQYYDITTKITEDVSSRNMSISLGLIPRNLDKDLKFLYWINKVKNDPRVEIALHGYDHSDQEFKSLNETEAYEKISSGKDLLLKYVNVVPATFIPPENVYSDGTKDALTKSGFKIISASKNEIDSYNNLTYLGYTAKTYYFNTNMFIPADAVLKDCDYSLSKKGLCVIMIHPQDYLEADHKSINQERYKEFLKLLDGIKQRNIETKRFVDVLNCTN